MGFGFVVFFNETNNFFHFQETFYLKFYNTTQNIKAQNPNISSELKCFPKNCPQQRILKNLDFTLILNTEILSKILLHHLHYSNNSFDFFWKAP